MLQALAVQFVPIPLLPFVLGMPIGHFAPTSFEPLIEPALPILQPSFGQ